VNQAFIVDLALTEAKRPTRTRASAKMKKAALAEREIAGT
jgi:hypothetical protein